MNSRDMLDYAFGLLDEPRRSACERELSSDPELSDRMARLGLSLNRLVDDGREIEPPAGLALRTIAAVEQRRRKPQLQDFAPTRVPFRWTDLAVAATVFLAGLLTLAVPLLRSRAQMDQTACSFNLGKLGVSLAKYASTHGSFPFVPAGEPAGAYGVMLHDSHDLTDPTVLACPCATKGKPSAQLPDLERFRRLVGRSPEACRNLLAGHFAYNVGYRCPTGETVPVPNSPSGVIPIASDGPPSSGIGEILAGNSPNHEGRGQNVLFSDGHVSWLRNRWISEADKDLFLNAEHRPAAGRHQADSSLVPSVMPAMHR